MTLVWFNMPELEDVTGRLEHGRSCRTVSSLAAVTDDTSINCTTSIYNTEMFVNVSFILMWCNFKHKVDKFKIWSVLNFKFYSLLAGKKKQCGAFLSDSLSNLENSRLNSSLSELFKKKKSTVVRLFCRCCVHLIQFCSILIWES